MTENPEIAKTETTAADDPDQVELAPDEGQQDKSKEAVAECNEQTLAGDGSIDEATAEMLREKLLAAESQAADNLDGWQRAQADYQNYKRRMVRDLEQARQSTAASVLSRFFPVLDDLQLALNSMPAASEGTQWSEGINLVHRKLLSLLEAENIAPVEAEPGQQFDPRYHEAVLQEENPDFKDGEITAVLRPGYQLGERVLRAAQVRVSK